MDKEKRDKYAEAMIRAYQNGVFKIIWSVSGFSMVIDSKRKELIPEVKEEDFVEYAFSIINMVVDLAEERAIDEKYEEDLEIAKLIFEKEYDLKNHLYIKKNSKIDCFKVLEYEIISHRNEEDPTKIEATSAIVKMIIENEDEETLDTFEVSRRDLDDIIDKLTELKDKIEIIQ